MAATKLQIEKLEAHDGSAARAGSNRQGERNLTVEVEGGAGLDVRRFKVEERMDELFSVRLEVLSREASFPLGEVVGKKATFRLRHPLRSADAERGFSGLCSHMGLIASEPNGLSTYELSIVPAMWLLTQRRNYRIFQFQSDLEIATKILSEWGVEHEVVSAGANKKRPYRVQYGETDYAFVCRLLESAGVSFHFRVDEGGTMLELSHDPQAATMRAERVPFVDQPTAADKDHVTRVRFSCSAKPGRLALRDHDDRLPASYALGGSAANDRAPDARAESFHYAPGAALVAGAADGATPTADDRGAARSDEGFAAELAESRLAAERGDAATCTFETSASDLGPGVVLSIGNHPHADVDRKGGFLIVASRREGTSFGEWSHSCEARPASLPYRPSLDTPPPRVSGVESATVVGPGGEEIHTDEFGRVRVHFHWDRESAMNEKSSCWIPVSQSWGGAGFGVTNLPRIGQEVIVDFLGGDPDRPVIVGRVYTNHQKTPYELPANKTQSGWRSSSTNHTGGYNEIMYEDRAGSELFRMQAERDLRKLVKHDEDVVIGRDRTKRVKRNDALTVDRDRQKRIDHDESSSIGHDRRELVENDELITIGNDRSKNVGNDDELTVRGDRTKTIGQNHREVVGISRTRMVGVNEAVMIGVAQEIQIGDGQSIGVGASQSVKVGRDQTTHVGRNRTTKVGRDQSTEVGRNRTLKVSKNDSTKVGGNSSVRVTKTANEMVGLAKSVTVGGAYALTVGAMMNTSVGGSQKEQIRKSKSVTAGKEITVTCGKTVLKMDAKGTISLEIKGGASIVMEDKNITLKAGAGGKITLLGGPEVHVNPPQ